MARLIEINGGIPAIKLVDIYDELAAQDIQRLIEGCVWLINDPSRKLVLLGRNQSVDMREIHTRLNERSSNLRNLGQMIESEINKSFRKIR